MRLPIVHRSIPATLLALVVALVAITGAACGNGGQTGTDSEEPKTTSGDTATGGPHGLAHGPGGISAIPEHNGHQRSRCANCHTAEDRKDPRWRAKVGMMGHDVAKQLQERTSCTCCHLGEIKGYGEPFEQRCMDCHDDIKVTIPKMGQTHCVGCHTLGAGDAEDMVNRAWECLKCHQQQQGNSAAIDVHGGEECSNCHQPHDEPWTKPRACGDCHEQQKVVKHGETENTKAGALICNDCHKPHEVSGQADSRCFDCHKEKTPEITKNALFKGHDACTNCHQPHEFDKASAKACGTCHKQATMTVSAKGADKHADCKSCHQPHDVKGSAAASCGRCHEVKTTHPDPKGTGCTTCHNPHPSAAGVSATALAASGCASCHTGVRAQQGKHASMECNKCHEKHNEGKAVVGCATCHTSQAGRVASNPKHQNCEGCHTGKGHRPTTNTGACGSCHDDEQKTAPAGHKACEKCHDTHSGQRLPIAQGCKQCHKAEAAASQTLKHGECEKCHRPHGPKGNAAPPTCTSCHQQDKLIGLHGTKGHETCTSCHPTPHVAPKVDRASCTSCHPNQKDHKPDATVCNGCHRFSGE
ncbi:MAG: hypothetical protein U0441_17330 [Polyangiaceae bacterium]